MSRAEERALEAYPKAENKVWNSAFGTFEFDENGGRREGFIKGYEQAEKDLTLTWEDIRLIDALICTTASSNKVGKELYEEVLQKFNESKKN